MKNIKLFLLFLTVFALNPFLAQAGTFSKFATSAGAFLQKSKTTVTSFAKKRPFTTIAATIATYGTIDYQNNKRELFNAAQTGDAAMVKDILSNRGWVPRYNTQNMAGNTPLHAAARNGQIVSATYLLHHQDPTNNPFVSQGSPNARIFEKNITLPRMPKKCPATPYVNAVYSPIASYIESFFGKPEKPVFAIDSKFPTNKLKRTPLHEAGLSCNEYLFNMIKKETAPSEIDKKDMFSNTAEDYLDACPKAPQQPTVYVGGVKLR